MPKSKSRSHKSKSASQQYGKKTGKRTFVNNLRLEMGPNVGLPSAIHNTNVNFVRYYKELQGPPKLGNGSNAYHNKTVRLPLLRKALAAGADLNHPEIPAGGGGGGPLPVMPWRPQAPSVGPHGGTFRGFNAGTGPFGALSPNLVPTKVNNIFSPKGGNRRKSQRKSRKNRKSRRSHH